MNKDQVKGMAKEAGGEVKEQTGKILNDDEMRLKGHAKEFEGKAQKKLGDIKETVKEDMDDIENKPENNQS
jgi:uncharacterized protein YjbJ (UPF0337 family)